MTNCNQLRIEFPPVSQRKVELNFQGGDISSDGGMVLLRQADTLLGLSKAVAAAIDDPRDPRYVVHSTQTLLTQRIYALALGYQDLNDHNVLRNDLLLKSLLNKDHPLGSASTLCRLQNAQSRAKCVQVAPVLV